jgi:hypothetical protein
MDSTTNIKDSEDRVGQHFDDSGSLSKEQLEEIRNEFGCHAEVPNDDPCPDCGSLLSASVDPSSLLSFPMKYVWSCASCGYSECREDKHVIENPGADAALVDSDSELF